MVPMRSRRHLDSARVFLSEQNMQQTKLNMKKSDMAKVNSLFKHHLIDYPCKLIIVDLYNL